MRALDSLQAWRWWMERPAEPPMPLDPLPVLEPWSIVVDSGDGHTAVLTDQWPQESQVMLLDMSIEPQTWEEAECRGQVILDGGAKDPKPLGPAVQKALHLPQRPLVTSIQGLAQTATVQTCTGQMYHGLLEDFGFYPSSSQGASAQTRPLIEMDFGPIARMQSVPWTQGPEGPISPPWPAGHIPFYPCGVRFDPRLPVTALEPLFYTVKWDVYYETTFSVYPYSQLRSTTKATPVFLTAAGTPYEPQPSLCEQLRTGGIQLVRRCSKTDRVEHWASVGYVSSSLPGSNRSQDLLGGIERYPGLVFDSSPERELGSLPLKIPLQVVLRPRNPEQVRHA